MKFCCINLYNSSLLYFFWSSLIHQLSSIQHVSPCLEEAVDLVESTRTTINRSNILRSKHKWRLLSFNLLPSKAWRLSFLKASHHRVTTCCFVHIDLLWCSLDNFSYDCIFCYWDRGGEVYTTTRIIWDKHHLLMPLIVRHNEILESLWSSYDFWISVHEKLCSKEFPNLKKENTAMNI